MRRLFEAIPILAFAYVLIGHPLLERVMPDVPLGPQGVWVALFLLTLVLAFACRRDMDLRMLRRPPVILLGLFLCLAGASVLWAYSPPSTFKRWIQAIIIAATVILPMAQKRPSLDIVNGIFWCYAAAIAINAVFVMTTPPMLTWEGEVLGHAGYFLHKQYLGMCASIAIIVSAYLFISREKRVAPLIVIATSLWLIAASGSKTSLGFAIIAPLVAAATIYVSKKLQIAAAWIVAAIPASYLTLGMLVTGLSERISYRIYGDATFTGRIFIWNFIETQTAAKPWLGWGFHSFWAVPYSPIEKAPGFVRDMPSSHNGYLDVRLELGYVGLTLFLAFLIATVYSLEHVRRSSPGRATLFLSLMLYVMLMNLLDTLWLIPFDPLWSLFLIVTAAAVRHANVYPVTPAIVAAEPKRRRKHWYPHAMVGVLGTRRQMPVVRV